MAFFITAIRALAACLITNSHYTGIYPSDMIANGGLLGDVLFFAVSGYCLYNVRLSFFRWYGKRLYRIYPAVVIITLLYVLMGFYYVDGTNWFLLFFYPTSYHFIASIVVLYIPFFLVMKVEYLRNRLVKVMLAVAVLWLGTYVLFFDHTYYHIDNVYSPMIWFLFFESMLLGARFREMDGRFRDALTWKKVVGLVFSVPVYFASKLFFARNASAAPWQFLNQIFIIILLFFLFSVFAGLDKKLEKLPSGAKKCMAFLAEMTLEIYIVQYVIIDELRNVASFPLNWLLLTSVILIAAYLLKKLTEGFYYLCGKLFSHSGRRS